MAVAAHWTKSVKFTLSTAVHTGGLAKKSFLALATQEKRIGEQLNYFRTCVLNAFHGQKIKENFFFRREVERTALSESGT